MLLPSLWEQLDALIKLHRTRERMRAEIPHVHRESAFKVRAPTVDFEQVVKI